MVSLDAGASSGRDVDYSSYEYQQVQFRPSVEGPDDDSTFIGRQSVEVLDQIGGLDSNEVAELVGYHRTATVASADFQTQASLQQGSFSFDYSMGVNLDSDTDLLVSFQNAGEQTTEIGSQNVNADFLTGSPATTVKDEMLDFASLSYDIGFEDEANGVGAGGDVPEQSREFMLRASLGAGPVLDSADELGFVFQIEKDNAEVGQLQLVVSYHLIWDVATVDDAGRRFGIPSDD